jgi:hypothetical protein
MGAMTALTFATPSRPAAGDHLASTSCATATSVTAVDGRADQ